MDYSKIPFHMIENPEIFPGTLFSLQYPASCDEKPVFIHPVLFSLARQAADSVFSQDYREKKLLFYCLEGDGELSYQDRDIHCGKGRGFFLDGDALGKICAGPEGMRYTLFTMNGELAAKLQKIAQARNAFSFDSDRFHDFEQRQFLLIRSFPGKLYDKEYDFSCHMDHLLVRILQLKPELSFPENDDHRQMIQQVLTYMQNHFSENLDIRQLAAQFHYSDSQFQKCFQEQTHVSAKQYLIRLRMAEAEKLLLNTNLSVEEVCTRCGFNNANHFIRAFRQNFGKTPLQYRKGKRGAQG